MDNYVGEKARRRVTRTDEHLGTHKESYFSKQSPNQYLVVSERSTQSKKKKVWILVLIFLIMKLSGFTS